VRLDDSFRYCEAEPDTAVIVASRLPEVIEEMRGVIRCDPRPRIGDLDDNAAVAASVSP
jgi:hypothetical protein